ncbi:unnamed protein product [Caenorhabditis bovis]|uniref:Uncharacterized protein n=1 Tax=Caenorhabditis bovis TaxID=2654633 RepID=A0A8S1F4G9_9PELO|nr:unnamed protein product [Caenorhabditis bovis]
MLVNHLWVFAFFGVAFAFFPTLQEVNIFADLPPKFPQNYRARIEQIVSNDDYTFAMMSERAIKLAQEIGDAKLEKIINEQPVASYMHTEDISRFVEYFGPRMEKLIAKMPKKVAKFNNVTEYFRRFYETHLTYFAPGLNAFFAIVKNEGFPDKNMRDVYDHMQSDANYYLKLTKKSSEYRDRIQPVADDFGDYFYYNDSNKYTVKQIKAAIETLKKRLSKEKGVFKILGHGHVF